MTAGTVTVTRTHKKPGPNARYTVEFSALPGKIFGPWNFAETAQQLRIAALLSPIEARNLIFDAQANGSRIAEVDA